MENITERIYDLFTEFGIESVMNELMVKHSNKVFIPIWFDRGHLERCGFKFDNETFDMYLFSDFMNGYGIKDEVSELIDSNNYTELWEEYKTSHCEGEPNKKIMKNKMENTMENTMKNGEMVKEVTNSTNEGLISLEELENDGTIGNGFNRFENLMKSYKCFELYDEDLEEVNDKEYLENLLGEFYDYEEYVQKFIVSIKEKIIELSEVEEE